MCFGEAKAGNVVMSYFPQSYVFSSNRQLATIKRFQTLQLKSKAHD